MKNLNSNLVQERGKLFITTLIVLNVPCDIVAASKAVTESLEKGKRKENERFESRQS